MVIDHLHLSIVVDGVFCPCCKSRRDLLCSDAGSANNIHINTKFSFSALVFCAVSGVIAIAPHVAQLKSFGGAQRSHQNEIDVELVQLVA